MKWLKYVNLIIYHNLDFFLNPIFFYKGQEFEKEIAPCTKILYFDVKDETMTERLLKRGQSSGKDKVTCTNW